MKMKKLALVIFAGLSFSAVTTGALADDKWTGNSGSNWLEHVQSTKTRAQVMEELKQAQARGEVRVGQDSFYPQQELQGFRSTRTRAEVQAEAAEAARNGNIGVNSSHYLGG